MIYHSLIVGALVSFSLVVQAGVVSIEGNSTEITNDIPATINAVLHKDVGLQQGGGNGRDVMEAQKDIAAQNPVAGCSSPQCEPIAVVAPLPRVQTLNDLLVLNKESSSIGSLIIVLLLMSCAIVYATCRAQSTK